MHSCAALARSLLALRGERRTGVLSVDADGARTFVYLKAGVPVFAEEGTMGESLGRMLVRQGQLTNEQHAEVIARMTDALFLNEQLRFGEVAVELGYLTEAQVRKALGDQVRWKIVRCFQRPTVTWSFEDSEARLEDVGNFPMKIEALFLSAVRWLDDDDKAELALRRIERSPMVLVEPPAATAARFDLSPPETAFLAAFDGVRTASQILSIRTEVDTPAIVTALAVMRAIIDAAAKRGAVPMARPVTPAGPISTMARPVTPLQPMPVPDLAAIMAARPPPPVAPATPSPAGDPSARRDTLTTRRDTATAARRDTATTTRRDTASRPRSRASQILAALEAQRVKPDAARDPATEHESRLLAERAYQEGLAHVRAGRWAQAAPEMLRASQLLPSSDEYRLYAKWCQVRARSNDPPHKIERAEIARLAIGSVKADPNFAFGWYVAGDMAFLDDEVVQAHRFLVRAVKLDPGNLDAQRLLRVVERRVKGGGESDGGGGILSKKLW